MKLSMDDIDRGCRPQPRPQPPKPAKALSGGHVANGGPDPARCRELAAQCLAGRSAGDGLLIATQLEAAADLAERQATQVAELERVIETGNEAFRIAREEWRKRIDDLGAEVARMLPVIQAAEQWRESMGARGNHCTDDALIAAVDQYRKERAP